VKRKVALEDTQKKLRTQICGKFNVINSADENKNGLTVDPLLKNYKKTNTFILDRRLRNYNCF
jgi:hypothetical protein